MAAAPRRARRRRAHPHDLGGERSQLLADRLGVLIRDPDRLGPFLEALDRAERVAIDTEFHAERRRRPELFVVSLATDGAEPVLIDAQQPAAIHACRSHMTHLQWIVHGGRQDLQLLEAYWGRPVRLFDTQVAMGLCTPRFPAPFDEAVTRFLGLAPAPSATMSDWSKRPLSPAQLTYALEDVARLLPLADALAAELYALGRTEVAAQAQQEMVGRAYDTHTDWRTLRGAEHLDPRHAAILAELCYWRDAMAEEQDLAPAAFLGDGHLLDLAKRSPITPESVGANRRFPKRAAETFGEAIAERVRTVWQRPALALPLTAPPGSPMEAEVAWWWAQVLDEGQRRRFAARLVFPTEALLALAAGAAPTGWRGAFVADWIPDRISARAAMRKSDRLC